MHHNYLNQECKNDRESLIKLILSFKKATFNIINENKVNRESLKNNSDYKQLKTNYEKVEDIVFDPDYFFCNVGENFNLLSK